MADTVIAAGALAECAAWLTTLAAGEVHRVAVAIEIPRGAIVELLVERGFHVFATVSDRGVNSLKINRLIS
jgi:hypothetical protein